MWGWFGRIWGGFGWIKVELAKCETDFAECKVELLACEVDLAEYEVDFAECEVDLVEGEADLAECEIDFAECEIDLTIKVLTKREVDLAKRSWCGRMCSWFKSFLLAWLVKCIFSFCASNIKVVEWRSLLFGAISLLIYLNSLVKY